MDRAPRKKASDFDPRILEIYDGYVHGRIGKRAFLRQAANMRPPASPAR